MPLSATSLHSRHTPGMKASCRLAQRGSQPDSASSHPPEEELDEKNEKDKDKEISLSSAVKMKEKQEERDG